jgi:N-acetyl-anhydromuramyl-L-alanine amidase AmpD
MLVNLADPGSPEVITVNDFKALMLDRRKQYLPVYRDKQTKEFVGYKPQKRRAVPGVKTGITGIEFHQTAADMGVKPERYDAGSIHYYVLRNGVVTWHCDEDRVLFGGNGGNDRCIQIEVVGRYSGLLDNPNTMPNEANNTTWNDPTTKEKELPQDLTIDAAFSLRMLVRYLCDKFPSIKYFLSHRNFSKDRQADPGQAIWEQVVGLRRELGRSSGGKGFVAGGYPNPSAWDAAEGRGSYYV